MTPDEEAANNLLAVGELYPMSESTRVPTPVAWDTYPLRERSPPASGTKFSSLIASAGSIAVRASRAFQPPYGAGTLTTPERCCARLNSLAAIYDRLQFESGM